MSTRPEYYSGRGATFSDLNEEILFKIHKDLQKEFGNNAGIGFVKMVNGIKILSATAFLNGLYELFYNNWEYNENQPSGISIPKDENDNYNTNIGMIGVMESLFSCGRDDTHLIKSWFLEKNGIKCEKIYYNEFGDIYKL
jgi:hypothetical protein